MRLDAITVFTVDLPLAHPFRHASSGVIDTLREVVVKVETQSGAVGWGEVRGNAPHVTAETQGRIVAALTELLIPAILDRDPSRISEVGRTLDGIVPGNTSAKAALEIAMQDAAAREAGLPLRVMLGGGRSAAIHVHGTVPFCSPEKAAAAAADYLLAGITTIKVRLGLPDFADDLARLHAVRAAVARHPAGVEVTLATDVNQGWSAKQALRNAARLASDRLGFELAWLEQPVPAGDLAALKAVRDSAAIPVFADEACGTPQDLLRIVQTGAADGVHLKLCKAGGIGRLMALVAIAEAAGLPYLMGQMDEGMLATAAALQCADASAPLSCELWGYQRVGWQPFSGLAMKNGSIVLPDAPGLGIAVDEAALTTVADFRRAA